jgi:hypothetical protein
VDGLDGVARHVIEIKKPFDDALMGRVPYRGNYIPTKEARGQQAEKYLFHLSKWGLAAFRSWLALGFRKLYRRG